MPRVRSACVGSNPPFRSHLLKSSFHRLDTLFGTLGLSPLGKHFRSVGKTGRETHVFLLEHSLACGPSLDGSSLMTVDEDNTGSILGFIVGLLDI